MFEELKKIRAILTPAQRKKSLWMLLVVMVMAGAEAVGVLSVMPFLSVLGRPEVIHENRLLAQLWQRFSFTDPRYFIIALGLGSIALVLVASAYKTVALHLVNRFIHLLRHAISSRLLERYLHQPYEFFLERNSAQLGSHVLSEVDQLLFNLLQPLSQLIAQGAVVTVMTVLVVWYDWRTAAIILLVLGTLYGAIYALVRQYLARIGHERQHANTARFKACNEALTGIKDVKVTHSEESWLGHFRVASRIYSRHQAASDTLAQSPLYIVEAVGYTGLILITVLLLSRSNDLAHILPALGLYGFAAYRMLPAAQIMYRGVARLRFSAAALDAIYSGLCLPEAPQSISVRASPIVPQHEIRLSNVTYIYPGSTQRPVLDHFDLWIPVGNRLAIMGSSGAGKSTLMDILLGLLQPQSGRLSVDGVSIDTSNVRSWQAAIGYVPQHIHLADASITENIAFGLAPRDIDHQAVERAARIAQIHDFVLSELPAGYATQVGDRGARLSGGQRQRLGIARALYHEPRVLLMDEATSALDAETASRLMKAISESDEGIVVIYITHDERMAKDATMRCVVRQPGR